LVDRLLDALVPSRILDNLSTGTVTRRVEHGMSELKLGNKFECFNCGGRFYDLGKKDPICPKCGANQKDFEASESTSSSQAARARRKAELSKKASEEDDLDDIEAGEVEVEELEGVDEDEFEDEEEEGVEDEA